jgi:hypothetical protein
MAITIRAQVFLCSHQSHLGIAAPGPSWHPPAGVEVELTPTRGRNTDPISLGLTDDGGLTADSPDLASGSYHVRIPGYDFAGDLKLTAAHDQQTVDVKLAPRDDHCLVLLQLTEALTRLPVSGATVDISSTGTFTSDPDGLVWATAPEGDTVLRFHPAADASGGLLLPADQSVSFTVQALRTITPIPVEYWPAVQISVTPTVTTPAGDVPLAETSVTVEYRGSPDVPGFSRSVDLGAGIGTETFGFPFPGVYVVTVTAPPITDGLPIKDPLQQVTSRAFASGGRWAVPAAFAIIDTEQAEFVITTPQQKRLVGSLALQIVGPNNAIRSVTGTGTSFTAAVPKGEPLQIRLDPSSVPQIDSYPLTMSVPEQPLVPPPATNTIQLDYLYSITGQISDEHGRAVPSAPIDIYDGDQNPVGTAVSGQDGSFFYPLSQGGTYYVTPETADGDVAVRERVDVNSPGVVALKWRRNLPGTGSGSEGLTDFSAYPVLTEEISTTGPPAPAGGGGGSGGPGAGYGQTVDQVMRDVLGWRPSGDVAGFQAALTGAFQLREVEGHTEWFWQQRGYAVQADMGALSGAQASIYARAKSALDQILPLLAGLTTLNPALYPPQDLEAIRTVVTAELNELVTELALPGGPRIQRVDQLFALLLGEGRRSFSLDPDLVGGNLGTVRDRFALTVDEIDTVDEERIVTNFRVIVEQVLALNASWEQDRHLLSGVSARTALGTVLILLSRSLEAVCESVDDLSFALDSVYVDAAQRQVIELRFASLTVEMPEMPLTKSATTSHTFKPHEPPLLLSDLLDWVTQASRDEGPRIIQDAGKDGVLNFQPVLDRLRILIHATRKVARHGATLPSGMQTPRVSRALQVLAAQLDQATNLAGLVRREPIPQIAEVIDVSLSETGMIVVSVIGSNLHRARAAVLIPEGRADLQELRATAVPAVAASGASITSTRTTPTASSATAAFTDPSTLRNTAGTTWLVALIDKDGTRSNQVEALRVPY